MCVCTYEKIGIWNGAVTLTPGSKDIFLTVVLLSSYAWLMHGMEVQDQSSDSE